MGIHHLGVEEEKFARNLSTNFTIATFDPSALVKHRFPNKGSPYNA